MTPEQRSRQEIDRQLEQAGWVVQACRDMDISAGLGVVVREFPLKSGCADYLLYVDGRVVGVIEAKPEGHNLTRVQTQPAGPGRSSRWQPAAARPPPPSPSLTASSGSPRPGASSSWWTATTWAARRSTSSSSTSRPTTATNSPRSTPSST